MEYMEYVWITGSLDSCPKQFKSVVSLNPVFFVLIVSQLSVSPLVEVMKIQEIDNPKAEEVDKETLIASLSALSTIYNGLSKIRLQQSRDRHRLDLHSETNETNYNNVFTGSIIETLVFILVACFQVCTK